MPNGSSTAVLVVGLGNELRRDESFADPAPQRLVRSRARIVEAGEAMAREHAARGACVALDVTSPRWPGDLDEPFGVYLCERCGIDAGPGLAACPRCQGPLAGRITMRGSMVRI